VIIEENLANSLASYSRKNSFLHELLRKV